MDNLDRLNDLGKRIVYLRKKTNQLQLYIYEVEKVLENEKKRIRKTRSDGTTQ